MAKVKITKTIVTKTPQLAEVLTEKGFEVGDEVEKDQLDELVNIANTSELKELTEADFEAEPALADSGLKVGDKVRLPKKIVEGEPNDEEQSTYVAASIFLDKNDRSVTYNAGDVIPNDWEQERIKDLLERGLIELDK